MRLLVILVTILSIHATAKDSNLTSIQVKSNEAEPVKTKGLFDFKNPLYNSLLIAKLKQPVLFTLYRYGDGGNPNSPVRVLLNIDGQLVEEQLPGNQGKKFVNLEAESTAQFYAQEISILTDPSQPPASHIVRGQFHNNKLDHVELIAPSWRLMTKKNENTKTTLVPLGNWGKEMDVRVNFGRVTVTSQHKKSRVLLMLYIDGKPLVSQHGTPYIFSEGNSVDLTAKSISVGFHPAVPEQLEAEVSGSYNLIKGALKYSPPN